MDLDVIADTDLRRIATDLERRFCPPLRPEAVRRRLLECVAGFDHAPVRTYLAILVQRAAIDRLQGLVDRAGELGRPAEPTDVVALPVARTYARTS